MGSQKTAPMAGSSRHHHAQQVRRKYRKELSSTPLRRLIHWLHSPEAIAAMGAKQAHSKAKELRKLLNYGQSIVCSDAWLRAFERGEEFPVAGMVLSKGESRIGEDSIPTRRFTPAIAVRGEDELDLMDAVQATYYDFPQSPSAAVIEQIGWFKAKPQGGNW